MIKIGVYGTAALVGGNSNNGANDGPSYFNLNNGVSNHNWNISASHSYRKIFFNVPYSPYRLVKIRRSKPLLKLKSNWQIFPILDHVHTSMNGRPLDFLGYKFYRDRVCLRGKIALKAQRKAKHFFKKGRANVKDARQIIVYASITRYANVYRWFKTHIDKYVDIKKMRKIVSTYDRSHQRRNNYA